MTIIKRCREESCCEVNPVFYKNRKICKVCYRENMRLYKQTKKGKQVHILANKKYRTKGSDIKDKVKWLKYNTVNRDTLQEQLFEQCTDCNENLDGQGSHTCSVANGVEDIKLCLVHQDWKQHGEHPLVDLSQQYDDCPYNPETDFNGE